MIRVLPPVSPDYLNRVIQEQAAYYNTTSERLGVFMGKLADLCERFPEWTD